MPSRTRECLGGCCYTLAPSRAGEVQEGQRRHHARGLCQPCYRQREYNDAAATFRWTRPCRGTCGKTLVTLSTRPRRGERKHHAQGMCHTCYVVELGRPKPLVLRPCKGCEHLMVPAGADTLGKFKRHAAHGLCTTCYTRERRANAEVHTD